MFLNNQTTAFLLLLSVITIIYYVFTQIVNTYVGKRKISKLGELLSSNDIPYEIVDNTIRIGRSKLSYEIKWKYNNWNRYANTYQINMSYQLSGTNFEFKVPSTFDYVFRSSQLFGPKKRKWIMKHGSRIGAQSLLHSSDLSDILSLLRKEYTNVTVNSSGRSLIIYINLIDREEETLALLDKIDQLMT